MHYDLHRVLFLCEGDDTVYFKFLSQLDISNILPNIIASQTILITWQKKKGISFLVVNQLSSLLKFLLDM